MLPVRLHHQQIVGHELRFTWRKRQFTRSDEVRPRVEVFREVGDCVELRHDDIKGCHVENMDERTIRIYVANAKRLMMGQGEVNMVLPVQARHDHECAVGVIEIG